MKLPFRVEITTLGIVSQKFRLSKWSWHWLWSQRIQLERSEIPFNKSSWNEFQEEECEEEITLFSPSSLDPSIL